MSATSTASTVRPQTTEYAPYYAKYISLVEEGDIATTLGRQLENTLSLLRSIPAERANFRYAPEKWSIKELLGHVIDAERIFTYRALRFARNDQNPLAGFDQEPYVEAGSFDKRDLQDLIEEFELLRRANIVFFRSLDESAWLRRGIASDNEVSVRALAYITAGHELHHMAILRDRYLQ